MNDLRYWLGCLILVLPLHGVEQLLFGLDELYELQGQMGAVLDLFGAHRDHGITVIVFVIVTLVATFLYCTLTEGRWRLLGFGFLGAAGVGEIHHVIKTIVHLDYFPGAVTAIAYVTAGGFLLRAVIREWRKGSGGRQAADPVTARLGATAR